MGIGFQFCKVKGVLEMKGGDGTHYESVYYHSKMVKVVSLVGILPHFKNWIKV